MESIKFQLEKDINQYKILLSSIKNRLEEYLNSLNNSNNIKQTTVLVNYISDVFSKEIISFPKKTALELIKLNENFYKLQEQLIITNKKLINNEIKSKNSNINLNYDQKYQEQVLKIADLKKENLELKQNLRKMFFKLKKTQEDLNSTLATSSANARLIGHKSPEDSYKNEMRSFLNNTTNHNSTNNKLFEKNNHKIVSNFNKYKQLLEGDFENLQIRNSQISSSPVKTTPNNKVKKGLSIQKNNTNVNNVLSSFKTETNENENNLEEINNDKKVNYKKKSLLVTDNFFKLRKSIINDADNQENASLKLNIKANAVIDDEKTSNNLNKVFKITKDNNRADNNLNNIDKSKSDNNNSTKHSRFNNRIDSSLTNKNKKLVALSNLKLQTPKTVSSKNSVNYNSKIYNKNELVKNLNKENKHNLSTSNNKKKILFDNKNRIDDFSTIGTEKSYNNAVNSQRSINTTQTETEKYNTINHSEKIKSNNFNSTNNETHKNRDNKIGKTIKSFIDNYKIPSLEESRKKEPKINNTSNNVSKLNHYSNSKKSKNSNSNNKSGFNNSSIIESSNNKENYEDDDLKIVYPEKSTKAKAIELLRSINEIQKKNSIICVSENDL